MKKSFAALISILLLFGCKTGHISPPTRPTMPSTVVPPIYPGLEPIVASNLERLEQIDRIGKGIIHDVAISPDGKTLAIYACTGVYLYDTQTWLETIFQSFDEEQDEKFYHTGAVALSQDGTKIAISGRYADSPVTIWDLASGEHIDSINNIPNGHRVTEIMFGPGDDTIMIRSNYHPSMHCEGPEDNLALHQIGANGLRENNIIFEINGCSIYPPFRFHFVGDNRLFLYKGSMSPYFAVYMVDTKTGEIILKGEFDTEKGDGFYDISTDGAVLAVAEWLGGKYATRILDSESKEEIQTLEYEVKFLLDNNRFIVKSYTGDQWGFWEDGKIDCTFDGLESGAIQWKLSSDGSKMATRGILGEITVWSVSDCTQVHQIYFNDKLPAFNLMASLSSDGKILAINSGQHIYVWQLDPAQEQDVPRIINIKGDEISTYDDRIITFLPGTHMLAVWTAKGTRLFDVDQWYWVGDAADSYNVAFFQSQTHWSPDRGLRLSDRRNDLRIWDKNGLLLKEISPEFQFYDALFSPDGQLLIFLRDDGMLSIWGVKK